MMESEVDVDILPAVFNAVSALAPRMTVGDVMLRDPSAVPDPSALRQQLVAIAHATGGHLETAQGEAQLQESETKGSIAKSLAFHGHHSPDCLRGEEGMEEVDLCSPYTLVGVGVGAEEVEEVAQGSTHRRDMWLLMYMMENHELRRRNRFMEDQDPYHIPEPVKPQGGPGGGGGGGGGPPGGDGGGPGHGPSPGMRVADVNSSMDDPAAPEEDLSLIEAVFAFVFGRGDANADLDKRRWRAIGLLLRQNKGAVYAEQVAPFLDTWLLQGEEQQSSSSSWWDRLWPINRRQQDQPHDPSRMHEGYMLAVLKRFGGHAESNNEGRLVYVFPHLQVTAAAAVASPGEASSSTAASTSRDALEPDVTAPPPVPPPIYERLQPLSDGGNKQAHVIGLGMANVILLLLFRRIGGLKYGQGLTAQQILESDREIGVLLLLLSYVPALLAWLFKPLLFYAVTFFAVPAARYVINMQRNRVITRRNSVRSARATEAAIAAQAAAESKAEQARAHQQFSVIVEA
eukprot:jgi/Mesen1/10945/ME000096S10522